MAKVIRQTRRKIVTRPQRENKMKDARAQVIAANTIPQLRLAVRKLIAANEEMQDRLDKLELKVGR